MNSRKALITLQLALLLVLMACDTETIGNPSSEITQGIIASECQQTNMDWLFCADFDVNDLTQWDALAEGQSRTILEDPGPVGISGNNVLQLHIPSGSGGLGLNKTFTNGYDRLYARWYVYYEDGFDFTARNHGHGLHAGDRWKKGVAGNRPNGDDWFTVQLEHSIIPSTEQPVHYLYAYYRGMSMDCSNHEGSCWGDMIPCTIDTDYYCKNPTYWPKVQQQPLITGRWYCIELMVDAGDPVDSADNANGLLGFWVDGEAMGSWTNMWFRTDSNVQLNHFWLGLFHHEEHSEAGLLFDNIVVSKSRIGCLK